MLRRLVLVADVIAYLWSLVMVYLYVHVLVGGVLGSGVVLKVSSTAAGEAILKSILVLLLYALLRLSLIKLLSFDGFPLVSRLPTWFDWLWAYSCIVFCILMYQDLFTVAGQTWYPSDSMETGAVTFSLIFGIVYPVLRWILTGRVPFRNVKQVPS